MRSILVVLALVATTGTGRADVIGTWASADQQTLKISYRNDNQIRMDSGPQDYMLVSGDKVYMVTQRKGKWSAMDMDEMAGMMKQFGMSGAGAVGTAAGETRLEPTGRKETVAGYEGKVYRMIHTDASGKRHEQEVVLSEHPDVEKLNRGWIVLASRMSQMMGRDLAQSLEQATEAAREQGFGGILRAGDDMVLKSLEKTSLSASHYQLPEGVEMMHMPKAASGGVPSPAGGTDTEQDYLSESADEIGDAAKDEAKDSAKEATKKGVRKALEGLW